MRRSALLPACLLALVVPLVPTALLAPAPAAQTTTTTADVVPGGWVVPAPRQAVAGPALTVDASRSTRRISPQIYGVNFAGRAFARAVRLPVNRWGGNATETYNWQVRGSNKAQDYFFENFADCWSERFDYCTTGRGYSAVDDQIEQDRATGTSSLITLPMMGWATRSVAYTNTNSCAYPSSAFDPQDAHDPFNPACGNGRRGGQWIPGADPATAGTPVGPAFSASWIASLKQRFGAANGSGVRFYELGNEPALWDDTHHPFHPEPTTYDELWAKSRDLAAAVKDTDPGAKTLGPSEWGWPNYFCSAADDVDRGCFASSPDRAAHGGLELSAWYLRQFAQHEAQTGRRLLDYFDLHYYPQGGYSPVTDVTRSLWDPTYTDPSWIGDTIRLLPRMRDWVAGNYPGTRLALTEYNLGLGVTTDPRIQNVVQADSLGIFGREGVGLATYWPQGANPVPEAAFRIFRNYDGQGHGFGDRGVAASSADQTRLSVYAARVGEQGALTVVVVNKATSDLRSALRLRGTGSADRAEAFRYAGRGIARLGTVPVTDGVLRTVFPASSVTLFEIALPTKRKR